MHSSNKILLLLAAVGYTLAATISHEHIAPPLEKGGQHWAVLVAGSSGWLNYRHQADVCHAYQIVKSHGVPEENIVVMMYDDIAYSSENPHKGVVINRPNGPNVYTGVKIDYRGRDVTPEVFLSVLQGKSDDVASKGTGKVIKSGRKDHVFVNFVDHGGVGLVAFPRSYLHAKTFMSALQSMHENNQYSQMVIYLEACESGSMFKNLLSDNMRIFATTASNAKESSYACYRDEKLNTYLGDLYSVNWMEDSDASNINAKTLQSQFEKVKAKTNRSHVQEYGDMSISKQPVGNYLGMSNKHPKLTYQLHPVPMDAVKVDEIEIALLTHQMYKHELDTEKDIWAQMIVNRIEYQNSVKDEMRRIVSIALNGDEEATSKAMSERVEFINFDCYQPAVDYYFDHCRELSTNFYALRVLYGLQNVCNMEVSIDTITEAMNTVCDTKI